MGWKFNGYPPLPPLYLGVNSLFCLAYREHTAAKYSKQRSYVQNILRKGVKCVFVEISMQNIQFIGLRRDCKRVRLAGSCSSTLIVHEGWKIMRKGGGVNGGWGRVEAGERGRARPRPAFQAAPTGRRVCVCWAVDPGFHPGLTSYRPYRAGIA
jgi:hypothetical protein